MSDDRTQPGRRGPAPGADHDAFGAVRQEVQEHRADTARMWRRVEAALDGDPVTSGGRPEPVAPRRRGPILAIAAGTALVILATTQLFAHPTPDGTSAAPATATERSTASAAVVTAPAPTTSGTTTAVTPAATPINATPTTGSTGPTDSAASAPPTAVGSATAVTSSPRDGSGSPGTTPPATTPIGYRWTALAPGAARTLSLPGPDVLDWVCPGARSDLVQERAKRPTTGQALAIDVPDGSRSAKGPLSVSWTDGFPEQEHAAVTAWLVTPRGSGVTVDVPAAAAARHLQIRLGGNGSPFTLELRAPGRPLASTLVTGAPTGADPTLLTVDVPAGSALQVRLIAAADAGNTGLSVGAVVLTR